MLLLELVQQPLFQGRAWVSKRYIRAVKDVLDTSIDKDIELVRTELSSGLLEIHIKAPEKKQIEELLKRIRKADPDAVLQTARRKGRITHLDWKDYKG